MSALSFDGLSVDLGGRRVLSGVSARLDGGFIAVCGPNGAGKTTLLRSGLGLVKLSQGRAILAGDDVRTLSPAERAKRAGYLPQERRIAWGVPALRVASLGATEVSLADAETRGREALAAVGLDGFEQRGVFEMSGGERARVLLARLFATGAPLLVLDEPAAGLDPEAQLLVLDLLRARASAGAVVVATLHDLGLAARYADRILVLDKGKLAADAAPMTALSPPVLAQVFGLDADWIETPRGPLLDSRRS